MNIFKTQNSETPSIRHNNFKALPAGIWVLGFVSMFMDISSELIHSLLPVFMASVLGASMTMIGIIEGFGEAAAAVTKVFSGAISDYLRKRKLVAGIGYGLAAAAKPIFPLASSIGWVFAARFVDRIGKGIRGAPRDALVADLAPSGLRGAAYGIRQSLDSAGAFIGPLLALIFMAFLGSEIRLVLWVAVFPALIAVALLIFGVHEPGSTEIHQMPRNNLKFSDVRRLSLRFWMIVIVGSVFTLARFSEAFLILRAQDTGMAVGYVPLVLIVMNFVYTVTAYPAGALADRFSQRNILIIGLAVLIIADLVLAADRLPWLVICGAALWGLHMGLTQGLFSKLVADAAPADLRGSAFGIFNLFNGGALLCASIIAGSLWTMFGASATFLAGAGFALFAVFGILIYQWKSKKTQHGQN